MKVSVHVAFEQQDLERLDAWARERRLTRGSAIMSLLDLVDRLSGHDRPDAPKGQQ